MPRDREREENGPVDMALDSMTVTELKTLMKDARISWQGCVEKADLVQKILVESNQEMNLKIQTPAQPLDVYIKRGATVFHLKQAIHQKDQLPVHMQRLFLNTPTATISLPDHKTLLSLGITEMSPIKLAVDARGKASAAAKKKAVGDNDSEGKGPPAFRSGSWVLVTGLEKAKQYNGMKGRVLSRGVGEERYAIQVFPSGRRLNIRAANLVPSEPPSATGDGDGRGMSTKSTAATRFRQRKRTLSERKKKKSVKGRIRNMFAVDDPVAAVRFLESNNTLAVAKPALKALLGFLQKVRRKPTDNRARTIRKTSVIHRKFVESVRGAEALLRLAGYENKERPARSVSPRAGGGADSKRRSEQVLYLEYYDEAQLDEIIAAIKESIGRLRNYSAKLSDKADSSSSSSSSGNDLERLLKGAKPGTAGGKALVAQLNAVKIDPKNLLGSLKDALKGFPKLTIIGVDGKEESSAINDFRGGDPEQLGIRDVLQKVDEAVKLSIEAKQREGQREGVASFGYWGEIKPEIKPSGRNGRIIPHGYGVQVDPLGNRHEGCFRDGKPNGYGRYTLAGGTTIDCFYRNGFPEGIGKQFNPVTPRDGTKKDSNLPEQFYTFTGGYRDGGKKNGFGILTGPQGYRYEGEYHDNKEEGLARCVCRGGFELYAGNYRNGVRTGPGVLKQQDVAESVEAKSTAEQAPDSQQPKRSMIQFEALTPTRRKPTKSSTISIYEGDFKAGLPHGFGVHSSDATATCYEGGFQLGQPHGAGVLTTYDPHKKHNLGKLANIGLEKDLWWSSESGTKPTYSGDDGKKCTVIGNFKHGHPFGYATLIFGGHVSSFRGTAFREPVSAASVKFSEDGMEEVGPEASESLNKTIKEAKDAQAKSRLARSASRKAASKAMISISNHFRDLYGASEDEEEDADWKDRGMKAALQWFQSGSLHDDLLTQSPSGRVSKRRCKVPGVFRASRAKSRGLERENTRRKMGYSGNSDDGNRQKQRARSAVGRLQKRPALPRCVCCNRKLVLGGFECRCKQVFCENHRLPYQHNCNFNIKQEHQERLRKSSAKFKDNRGLEDVI